MSPDAESHASATVASDSALHPQGSCTCHAILPFEWPSKSNGTSWSLEASPVNEQLMNSGLAKPFAPFPPCQNWHRVLKPCRGKSRFSNSGPHKSHWWPRVINFSETFVLAFRTAKIVQLLQLQEGLTTLVLWWCMIPISQSHITTTDSSRGGATITSNL